MQRQPFSSETFISYISIVYPHLLLIIFIAVWPTSFTSSTPVCPGAVSLEKITWHQPNLSKYPRGDIFYDEPSQGITIDCLNLCFRLPTCSGLAVDYKTSRCYSFLDVPSPESSSRDDLIPSPGVNYFQKICYTRLTDKLCPKFWTTDEFLGGYLGNFIHKELSVKSRIECTTACLIETSFICRSASFDQASKRCLLSVETRRTQPQAYRHESNTSSWIYTENHCTSSSGDMTCSYDRRNDKSVASMDSLIYAKTVKECESYCLMEKRFTCRSYSFYDFHCQLSSDDRVSLGTINEAPSAVNTVYGELLCSRDDCIYGKFYFEKIVGYTLSSALEEEMNGKDSYFLQECQTLCDRLGPKCRAVLVDYNNLTCFRLDRNSQGRSIEFIPKEGQSYLEKTCLKIESDNCPSNGVVFSRILGYEFPPSVYRRTLSNIQSRQECEQKCLSHNQLIRNKRQVAGELDYDEEELNEKLQDQNSISKVSPFVCKSAHYDEVTTECRLSNESFLTHQLVASPRQLKASHLENHCVPNKKYLTESQGVGNDSSTSCTFTRTPKEVIVYADEKFMNIKDAPACEEKCRQSASCLSFSFSPQSKECILSSESENSPGIKVTKASPKYDSYQILCRKRRQIGTTSTKQSPTTEPIETAGTTTTSQTTTDSTTFKPMTIATTSSTTPIPQNVITTQQTVVTDGVTTSKTVTKTSKTTTTTGAGPTETTQTPLTASPTITTTTTRSPTSTTTTTSTKSSTDRQTTPTTAKTLSPPTTSSQTTEKTTPPGTTPPSTSETTTTNVATSKTTIPVTKPTVTTPSTTETTKATIPSSMTTTQSSATTTQIPTPTITTQSSATTTQTPTSITSRTTSAAPITTPPTIITTTTEATTSTTPAEPSVTPSSTPPSTSSTGMPPTETTTPSTTVRLTTTPSSSSSIVASSTTLPPPNGTTVTDQRPYCRKTFESSYERIPGFEPIGSYFFTLLCGSSESEPGIINECSKLCNNKPDCQGFVVDYKNHLCYGLITDISIPHLTLCVSDSKDFFNRICIPSSLSCNKLYTFERIVDQAVETPVLPRYTLPFITKEACKCLCLEEKKFTCRAVSFEFTNSICRIYDLDRSSPSLTLRFERGFEYIENMCAFNPKPCSYSRPVMDVSPISVMKSLPVRSIYECKHACDTSINFNCRSFNFVDYMSGKTSSNICILNADNQMTIKKGNMKFLPRSLYYERHCPA